MCSQLIKRFGFNGAGLLLLCSFLLISCSIEKRLYQRGYHIEWRKKIKPVRVSAAKIKTELEGISLLPADSSTFSKKEKESNTLIASNKGKWIINSFLLGNSFDEKERRYKIKSIGLPEDSVFKQKPNSNEKVIKKLAKKSLILGIISAICTIPTPLLFLTYPVALICGILAIRKGRRAIKLMDNDSELNNNYRSKARNGIRLGMTFFILLITATLITLLILIALILALSPYIYAYPMFMAASYTPILLFFIILIGLLLITLFIWLYIRALKKIYKTIPPKHIQA